MSSVHKSKLIDEDLTEYNFDNYLTNKIFKNLPINLATFFRQYNFFKLIRTEKLNFFLLKSKTFNYPLTHEQIIILRKNGFIINNFISNKFNKQNFENLVLSIIIRFIFSTICHDLLFKINELQSINVH